MSNKDNNIITTSKPLYRHMEVYEFTDKYKKSSVDYDHRYMSWKQKGFLYKWSSRFDDIFWNCNSVSEFLILRNLHTKEEQSILNLIVCLIALSPGRIFKYEYDLDNPDVISQEERKRHIILSEIFEYIVKNNESVYEYY